MEHVILPAISNGRFIITNIDGLDCEAIYQYAADQAPRGKIICIGHIRHCDRSAPDEEDFFPTEAALDQPMPVPDPDYSRVCGGDLVVIDEATRHWATGEKIKRSHAYFFREHRHFTNEMGHTCDLVVIDPDLTMLARALKGKVELSSVTHKPKSLGLNRYSVNLYRGVRLSSRPISSRGPFPFRPEIYALYKSYSHSGAKEQQIDKRQNILRSPALWMLVAGVVVAIGGGGHFAWRFFHPAQRSVQGEPRPSGPAVVADSAQPGSSDMRSASTPADLPPARNSDWRIAGSYRANGVEWVILVDGASRPRVESPSMFHGQGISRMGTIEGKLATTWSGSHAASGMFPGGAR
jgi:zona occludens toxin